MKFNLKVKLWGIPWLNRYFLIMKLTFILLLTAITALHAESYGQLISIKASHITLSEFIKRVEVQSGYQFIYNKKDIINQEVTHVQLEKITLQQALTEVLGPKSISYKIVENYIVLKKSAEGPVEKKLPLVSQLFRVTGVINDDQGAPIPGVTVSLKGTTTTVVSDAEGKYSIQVPEANAILVFSSVGYIKREIPVNSQAQLNVALQTALDDLEEVVVVGYGTQKKANLTGAVSTIAGRELEQAPNPNLSNSIAGRVSGVIVNTRTGEPGNDNAEIHIRGKGTLGDQSPLIVIDGVPDRTGGFARLSSSDIASFTVLKDANASIYGARAANGVILITTKRGAVNKTELSFQANLGFSQPTRKPKMLDAYEYALAEIEYYRLPGAGTGRTISDDDLRKYQDGSSILTHPNTNWWDEIMRSWTPQQNYVLSASGGSDKVQYYLSGQYLDQEGNYKGGAADYNQKQARANIDIKATESFKIGLDVMYRNELRNSTSPGYGADGVYGELWFAYPYLTARYPNGNVGVGISGSPINSMIYVTNGDLGYQRDNNDYLQTKASFDWNLSSLTAGLSLSGFLAYDLNNSHYKGMRKTPPPAYLYDVATDDYRQVVSTALPELTETRAETREQLYNVRLGYNRTFGKHTINAFAAYEYYHADLSGITAYRRNLLSNDIEQLITGSEDGQQIGSTASEAARINYISRISYDYANKYLFDLNMRYDGSQNFPKGKRFGFFPGLSAAWRVSQESFFSSSVISELKIRGSWGKMGNDKVPPFYYIQNYNPTFGYYLGNNAARYQKFMLGATPNPNITWEIAKTTNLGLDVQFLQGKLGFTLDAFRSLRTDILIERNASVPEYTGLTLPPENLGRVLNRGIEMESFYNQEVSKDFNLRFNGTFTFARNKILFIDEAPNIPEYQRQTGFPMDSWSLLVSQGLYQNAAEVANSIRPEGAAGDNVGPGDIRYSDINGDGVINDLDRVKMTLTRTPEIIFGFGIGGNYKKFDFNFFFQGQARAKALLMPNGLNMSREFFDDRWQQEGDQGYPRNFNGPTGRTIGTNSWQSDFWLRDASFLRLKNAEVGYSFSGVKVGKKFGMQSLRIYINGANLLSFDQFGPSFDPEGPNDFGKYYPQQRIINIGINAIL